MSTERIYDYLTKQLSIENSVVTFRLLSREMEIHVNVAKRELERYRKNVDAYATYIISGLSPPRLPNYSQDDGMDVDGWDEDYDENDRVQEIQVLLVGEEDLENSKSQFSKVHSVHVYSLSPTKLLDTDLVCPPTDKVRLIDSSERGQELAPTIGKIIGPDVVQTKAINSIKGKGTALAASASSSRLKSSTKDVVKEKEKEQPKPNEKDSRGSGGKLDWSKAKSKEDARKEKEVKEREKQEKENEKVKTEKHKTEGPAPKRGLKRKSTAHIISDSEEDREPVVTVSKIDKKPSPSSLSKGARVTKGVVLSDEDDDRFKPAKNKGKSRMKAEESESERSLRGMMDIDDDEVEKVSRVATKLNLEEHVKEEEEEEEEEMYEEPEPEVVKRKPRKKKEKKIIPIGKNGLKKKRIVKSRMTVDAKGYMVTEDYSSYESVDEEEQEEPASKKKGASSAEAKTKPNASSSSKTLNRKPSTSGSATKSKATEGPVKSVAGQKNLMNFFGKKP